MSLPNEAMVTCPECGNEFSANIWLSVNSSVSPDLKAKLMSGDLNLYKCPKCECRFEPDSELVYHDPDKKFLIRYIPLWDGNLPAIENGDEILRRYTLRIVTSRNMLIEKIKIFDDGLDDRVIESIKLYYLYGTRKIDLIPEDRILYLERDMGEDSEIVFLIQEGDFEPDKVRVPYKNYVGIADEVGGYFSGVSEGKWGNIGRDFATAVLSRVGIIPTGRDDE
ncbi:MAG: hypothetical protein A2014_06525 [Spirochaetes bacterium GWF1_49_6]|nr:MAG: hypothetical protein A2014_06525 [Spirochaetes bacterium GWF1_49_6]